MVGHAYKASVRDLRTIEERNPENVFESAVGMNLTVSFLKFGDEFFFFYIFAEF